MPQISCGVFTIDYLDTGAGLPVILIPSSRSGNRQRRKLVDELSDQYQMISKDIFWVLKNQRLAVRKTTNSQRLCRFSDCTGRFIWGANKFDWAFFWGVGCYEGGAEAGRQDRKPRVN